MYSLYKNYYVLTNKKVTVSSVCFQNRLKQCFKHMFGRINELLIISTFEDYILLVLMKKTGPGKQVRIIEVRL